jgi:hypothetical protein
MKNMAQGHRFDRDCLLHKTEEELAAALGSSPVESEGELVQVIVEMLAADRPRCVPIS